MSHDITNMSHDITNMSHDITNMSHDITNMSHDITNMSHDITNMSHDITTASKKADSVTMGIHNELNWTGPSIPVGPVINMIKIIDPAQDVTIENDEDSFGD